MDFIKRKKYITMSSGPYKKSINKEKPGIKKGKRKYIPSPSLDYKETSSSEKLNKAFDILFNEVLKINNLEKNYESNN